MDLQQTLSRRNSGAIRRDMIQTTATAWRLETPLASALTRPEHDETQLVASILTEAETGGKSESTPPGEQSEADHSGA